MILFQVLHISTLFSNQSIFDHLKPAVVFFLLYIFGDRMTKSGGAVILKVDF